MHIFYPEEILEETIKSCRGTIIPACIWRVLWLQLQNRTVVHVQQSVEQGLCSHGAQGPLDCWAVSSSVDTAVAPVRKAWHCCLWSTRKHSCLTLWCALPLTEWLQQFQWLVTSHTTLHNCSVNSQSWAKGSTKKHGVKFHNDLTSSLLPFALLKIISDDF